MTLSSLRTRSLPASHTVSDQPRSRWRLFIETRAFEDILVKSVFAGLGWAFLLIILLCHPLPGAQFLVFVGGGVVLTIGWFWLYEP